MDEREWLTSADPQRMLTFLRDSRRITDRKARLFAVACCRRNWTLFPNEDCRKRVQLAERYADGLAGVEELDATELTPVNLWDSADMAAGWATNRVEVLNRDRSRWNHVARDAVAANVASFARKAVNAGLKRGSAERPSARTGLRESWSQAALLRDIFGNPFRKVGVQPAWLSQNGGIVIRLAQAAYDDRIMPSGTLGRSRLAVLADSLEEAGCRDAAILGHLRGPGPHVRGCWALDAILANS